MNFPEFFKSFSKYIFFAILISTILLLFIFGFLFIAGKGVPQAPDSGLGLLCTSYFLFYFVFLPIINL